jgi:hypothetical protein
MKMRPQQHTVEGNLEEQIDDALREGRWRAEQCAIATRAAVTGKGSMKDYNMELERLNEARANFKTLQARKKDLDRFTALCGKFSAAAQGVSDNLKAFRKNYDALHVIANRICASFPGDAALCAPLQPSALRRMVEIELTKTVVSDLRAPKLPAAIGAGDMDALVDPAGTKPLATLADDLTAFLVEALRHHLETMEQTNAG